MLSQPRVALVLMVNCIAFTFKEAEEILIHLLRVLGGTMLFGIWHPAQLKQTCSSKICSNRGHLFQTDRI